jgi:folate-binding protein YgfZ
MANTILQEALIARTADGARPVQAGEYRGATVATSFGDPQREYLSLLQGCGIYDLGFRAHLSITGGDRIRWMNGMVTNNIRDLAVGHGAYAFLLNPQGRILGDLHIYNRGESLLVETDRSQVEKIVATFDHFIIMDDVQVSDVSEKQGVLGLAGPGSRELLNCAGIAVPEMQPLQVLAAKCDCDCACLQCTVIQGEDSARESYELWLDPKDVYKTWQALLAAGATAVGSQALEMQRIAAGVPLYGVDIRERDLPQETEQARALNFNKGCYVGQEIVERIRSRGNVHRKFTGFVAEGVAEISMGAKIISGEKEVGEITSVAVLRDAGPERTVALGYIRREIAVPGREVTIGDAQAKVIQFSQESSALRQPHDAVLGKA